MKPGRRAHVDVTGLARVVVAAALLIGIVASTSPALAAGLELLRGPNSLEISPDGDQQDDEAVLFYAFSAPVRATVEIWTTSAPGSPASVRVATLLSNHPEGLTVRATWDGVDATGLPVPPGDYEVRALAVSADGAEVEHSAVVTVSRAPVVSIATPQEGSVVSGVIEAVLVPRSDITMIDAWATFHYSSSSERVAEADPDGKWRLAVDTVPLSDGDQPLLITVNWTDKWGTAHFWSRILSLTVDNASLSPASGMGPL